MDVVRVEKIVDEAHRLKTVRFKWDARAEPGQFVMVWLPGVDEVPMSLSYIGKLKGITVENIGKATNAIHNLKLGTKIGVRGPSGKGFMLNGKNVLVVGGGSGMACLAPTVEVLAEKGCKVSVSIGARTKDALLFVQRIKRCGADVMISTDDGSEGHHGFVTELAEKILEEKSFDSILTCGPEIMMKKVLALGLKNKTPVQASLERYMKCGIGLCDSCAFNGYHVCRDGPVFSSDVLRNVGDFGKFRRDACGRRERIG